MATNLELIKSETISTGVGAVTIDNIFSDKYDVYALTGYGKTDGTDSASLRGQLLDSTGTVITASEYDYAYLVMYAHQAFGESRQTSTTFINNIFGSADNPETANAVTYIFNPFDSSSYTFFLTQNVSFANGNTRGDKLIGVHKSAESCRGLYVYANVLTRTWTGKISVFGVK